MADTPEWDDQELPEESAYEPASPVKRTMAWIGVVYMLIIVALTTYIYYTGTTLGNLAPLLVVPALVGAGALSIVSWRSTGKPGKWSAILIAAAAWLLALATLPLGIAGLMSNFGG